ncbi:von Willebrand factor type A domain protein [Planctomycetales bacterium 10988]|nr:von Willebrand factor type A domain protein [Planctomycetales bacterium 10988]
MIPASFLKKIHRISIRTQHRVDEVLGGQYHSAFKGRGIEFEEVRPYQMGDDVRTIDWNVTARSGEPYVKLFREERELSVWLLADISASQAWGTQHQSKRDLMAEIGATLAFAAIRNNDKVGLLLFTDEVEKCLLPKKGSQNALRIIRELLFWNPQRTGTNLAAALDRINRTVKRKSILFIMSDFQDQYYEHALRVARKRHDIVPLVIHDRCEEELPKVGLLEWEDAETGERVLIDTLHGPTRRAYAESRQQIAEAREQLFRQMRVEPIQFATGEDLITPLKRFFHHRESRS